ncbi:hypothetical protein [Chitinophaga rhizosphaerae]|uniref:hypothetical protein n=1 Tax=Chitinophaga rhizosphaerae TaxID=1864947 RepID=UPI000F80D912|nr:hypothetical protein [Chitinophaga rhizosphaerae]
MRIKLYVFILAFPIIMFSCAKLWGDNDLGSNLTLLEGDRKEDRVIVYCSSKSGVCESGIPVVPKYERQFNKDGRYAEFVDAAVANKDWIIVRTIELRNNSKNYWLIDKKFSLPDDCININCDSILQKHVIGPLDSSGFIIKTESLNINLSF